MNWIFDTYSNVYKTAMMQPDANEHNAAPANTRGTVKRNSLFGLFAGR